MVWFYFAFSFINFFFLSLEKYKLGTDLMHVCFSYFKDHSVPLYFIRFNDIHVPIRLECVKFASHCLMNHPDLAKDLTGTIYM